MALGGVGNFRQWDDPNDPRRGTPRGQRSFSSKEERDAYLAQRRKAEELAEARAVADQIAAEEMANTTPRDAQRYTRPVQSEKFDYQGRDITAKRIPSGEGSRRVVRKQQELSQDDRILRQKFLTATPEKIVETNPNISRESAVRIQQYLNALPELNVQQAVYLVQNEGITDTRRRRAGSPAVQTGINRRVADKVSALGDIGADPAGAALVRAAISGDYDVTQAPSDQTGRINPYIKAAQEAKPANTGDYQEIENKRLNQLAAQGRGQKVKPKKSAELSGSFVVPALMAPVGEYYDNQTKQTTPLAPSGSEERKIQLDNARRGLGKVQPAMYKRGNSLRINPTAVSLELIDPTIKVPVDIANRYNAIFQELNPDTGRLETTGQTLGQAINTIARDYRADTKILPDSQVKASVNSYTGRVEYKFGDTKVLPVSKSVNGMTEYRIGTNKIKIQGLNLINDLLAELTGKQLVVNQGITDPEMRSLQEKLMQFTKPGRQLVKGGPNETETGAALMDLIDQLQEGRNIERTLGMQLRGDAVPALASDRMKHLQMTTEADFFRKDSVLTSQGQQIAGVGLDRTLNNLRTTALSYGAPDLTPPAVGATPEALNAPVAQPSASPKPPVRQANIPAGMRPTTSSGLDKFIQMFKGRRGL